MSLSLFTENCYVMDTNFFVTCRSYYHENFPSFWEKMNEAVLVGKISSVKEVQKELENYRGEQDHLLDWIKRHKHIFTEPTIEELDKIREILAIPKFQKLINHKNIKLGWPAADPFLIAKAWTINGIVVTTETFASGEKSPKIPDVCKHLGVKCMHTEEFVNKKGWQS